MAGEGKTWTESGTTGSDENCTFVYLTEFNYVLQKVFDDKMMLKIGSNLECQLSGSSGLTPERSIESISHVLEDAGYGVVSEDNGILIFESFPGRKFILTSEMSTKLKGGIFEVNDQKGSTEIKLVYHVPYIFPLLAFIATLMLAAVYDKVFFILTSFIVVTFLYDTMIHQKVKAKELFKRVIDQQLLAK